MFLLLSFSHIFEFFPMSVVRGGKPVKARSGIKKQSWKEAETVDEEAWMHEDITWSIRTIGWGD